MIATVNLQRVMRQTSLRIVITGRRRTALRCRLGVHLLTFAAAVIGCGVTVDFDEECAISQENCADGHEMVDITHEMVGAMVC